jgi:hypothetical protein
MTAGQSRLRAAGALGVALVLAAGAGCGDAGASEADARACRELQQVVDDIAGGRSTAAMANLSELDVAVQLVDDDRLKAAGDEFFEGITGEVEDFGELTVEQTNALSRSLVADLVPSLGTMLQRCEDLDATVDLRALDP